MGSKVRRREQKPKDQNRGKDPNRLALSLRNGDGYHKNPKAYTRKPKHGGWA